MVFRATIPTILFIDLESQGLKSKILRDALIVQCSPAFCYLVDVNIPNMLRQTIYILQEKRNKAERYFHNENLTAVVNNLFAAGMDTTSTTLRWAILLMMKYPDIQSKHFSFGWISIFKNLVKLKYNAMKHVIYKSKILWLTIVVKQGVMC